MKKRIISIAAACMLSISCLSMNNVSIESYAEEPYHCTIESFMEGYVKVETGSLYEKIALSVTYGHVNEYDIYVHTNGKDVGMKSYLAIPRNNYAEFIISETVDLEEAWDAIWPILKKYSLNCRQYINEKYRTVELIKSDNQSTEDFVNETESLMIELKNTGYVSQFYPPGSLNDVTWISGNFEYLGVSGSKRETLLNYINENLPNYSLSDEGWLIPDDSLTLQERFDVVQKIYDDIGIGPAFGTVDIAYDYVGNGINLLEDIEPTEPTEPTEAPTDPTEPTESTTENVSEGKITDINVICDMINEEIKKERIPGQAKIDSDNYPDFACVCLDAETGNNRFQKWIENFIKEKNIDSSKVKFLIADIYVTGWLRDVNGDDKINVRDCAYIASKLAKDEELSEEFIERADYNSDGKVDVRDVADLAHNLSKKS